MFTTKHLVLAGFLTALAAFANGGGTACAADADKNLNTLTAEEKSAGWKLLFDGKSTAGWRKYKGKEAGDKWQAKDGILVFDPKGGKTGGDIVTADRFDNFELVLEWKIVPGGNSGIMYRVSEEGNAPWHTGPEYQLLDNAKHADGKIPSRTAASCYDLYTPSSDKTVPVGEWNKTRIVVNGNKVEHWLNGDKVVSFELGSDDWNSKFKASKFKDLPKFGKEPKGHICLQDHGDRLEFRNIKVRVLTEKKEK